MPELPEVETIARQLNGLLPGRTVERVRVFRENALQGVPSADFAAAVEGRSFSRVWRRGKYLLFDLAPSRQLVGHLRMTGKFVISPRISEPKAHHRVWFTLDNGEVLVFVDARCFGTLSVVEHAQQHRGVAKLGVEPLSAACTARSMAEALGRSRSPLKHWLMDQSRIAGLGNIYVSELLHAAGLSPFRPANAVSAEEAKRLHGAMRRILRAAIAKNGTTISDFRRVDEKSGEFQDFLRVYGKMGQPCPQCRVPIQRVRQQQRSTFYCPECQA